MADLTNILAMGPQPTIAWKSPVDIAAQQAATEHAKAATQSLQQETAITTEKLRQDAERRTALATAAREAQGDPKKLLQSYLSATGDVQGADAIQKSMDEHATAVLNQDEKARAAHLAANARRSSAIETILNEKDPVAQARARSMANAQLVAEGLDPLPDGPAEQLQTLHGLLGVEGSIAKETTAKADEARKQAAELRAQQEASIKQEEENRKAEMYALQMADPDKLTPEQRQQAKQAAAIAADREADNKRAEDAARIAADRLKETERHNRENEVRMAKIAAGQGAALPELANTPKALQAPAAAAYSKSAIAYADAKAAADEFQGVLDLVKSGNKAAGSNLPLLGVNALNAINGIKRINKAEIEQYEGAGSLYDNIVGRVGKLVAGQPIPADVLKDIEQLHTKLADGALRKHKAEVDAINKSHGSSFKVTEGQASQATPKATKRFNPTTGQLEDIQ